MNLFKKKLKQVEMITQSVVKTNSEIVQEIHNEFDTSWQLLLKEAKDILEKEQDEYLLKKADRLKALGFGSTNLVKTIKKENEEKNEAKIQADLIEYYRIKYPMYKFINEESVGKICEKYGLVKGYVSWYVGNVPEKNLQDIEKFNIKDEDCGYLRLTLGHFGSRFVDTDFKDFESYKNRSESLSSPFGLIYSVKKKPLSIVAPIKEFDTKKFNLEKIGYNLNRIIEDPVVLQPVKGGY